MLFFFFLVGLGCLVMLVMIHGALRDLLGEIRSLQNNVLVVAQTVERTREQIHA